MRIWEQGMQQASCPECGVLLNCMAPEHQIGCGYVRKQNEAMRAVSPEELFARWGNKLANATKIQTIRLNIGSGQRRFEGHGWVNIDCVSRPGQVPDIVCDVLKEPLPFEDGSVDLVMMYHFFEHLPLMAADGVVAECHRVLRPGGSLVIVVPDLRALAQRWLSRQISDFIYIVNLMGADQGEPGDIHRWHYTSESLTEKLSQKEWAMIRMFDWRKIPGMEATKDWWYWGAEATK